MFYSQFILAKKGPLGTIWIAAHLERKLRKNQVADTDIGVSVDSILSPDVPIALRLSSHLLLGVVRIYNKKVNYLFDDCSEALLEIKQAFRSTAVDLPPEESKAPYHSITLPETFDLDDFELPDSDIFQGNYVDHHISLKEQITLQDTMEGVSYSTSKFGLDERFGDGDASRLDLDEELFLDKVGTEVLPDKSVDPDTSFGPMCHLKHDEQPEGRVASSEIRVDDDDDEDVDLMDYAQAPCTPGLVEQPNLSNVHDSSACEDHLEPKDHLMTSTMRKNANDNNEDKVVHQFSQDDTVSNTVYQGMPLETEHALDGLQIEESKPKEESPVGADLLCEKEIIKTLDIPCPEELTSEAVKEYNSNVFSVDETHDQKDLKRIGLEKSDFEISGLDSIEKQTFDYSSEKELVSLGIEVSDSLLISNNQEKSFHDDSVLGLDNHTGSILRTPETQAGEEIIALNLGAHNKVEKKESLVPSSCKSVPEYPSVTTPVCSMTTEVEFDTPMATNEGEDKLGEASCVTGSSEQILKDTPGEEHALVEDIQVSAAEANDQAHAISQNNLVDNLTCSPQSELPAPEKLLSVPEGHMYLNREMEAEVSPRNLGEIADGDAGSKSAAGRKRSFTESTLTEQSLNSVESSRQVRVRTVESVPDDDDLLSSILVGRRSSVLQVKPTPLSEVTSVKRTRTVSRPGAPKRKVLMDDTMVLHGDTIRQQLTNTEDIRRVRKKAPCTLPEILIIQKQLMEDEIFLKTSFTGMSTDLVPLHSQVYDLSQIRVCQNNATDASLEIMTNLGLPSQEGKIPSLGTRTELNLTSCHAEHIPSLETVPEWHSTSPIVKNRDMESNEEPGKINVMEVIEDWVNNEHFIVTGNDMAEVSVNPQLNESMLEVHHGSVEVNITPEQSNLAKVFGPDGLHQELSLNVTDVGKSHINSSAVNAVLNAEMEPFDFTKHESGIMGVESVPDAKAPDYTVELDCADVDGPSFANHVVATVLDTRDDSLPDEAAATVLVCDSNSGELEYNIQTASCNVSYEEKREMDFPYMSVPSVLEDGSRDNGEKNDNLEDIHPNVADAEISRFDIHDQDELNYFAAGNDTEFLNVDDDELTEIDDDHLPDAEERQYTENSGWSSRTRAVSKFLQAAFIKEAESGRTYLSMDNLLIGKSRKEASRMFFETLVLKTRDYIHVEQRNPFDGITMKPRTRMMKSDF